MIIHQFMLVCSPKHPPQFSQSLSVKVLRVAYKTYVVLPSILCLSSSPTLPLALFNSDMLASLLFLKHTKPSTSSGPQHCYSLCLGHCLPRYPNGLLPHFLQVSDITLQQLAATIYLVPGLKSTSHELLMSGEKRFICFVHCSIPSARNSTETSQN